MGYERNRNRPLELTDPQFAGFEVIADKGTVEQFFEITDLLDRQASTSKEALDDLVLAYDKLVPLLASWNLEEKGVPVPLNRDTFGAQDRELTGAIIGAWRRVGVSRPLPQPSPAGEQSVAASIPMETLPAPQPS